MKILLRVVIFIIASKAIFSYANCPNPNTFEVTENSTFIAKTNQGIWQQIVNYQSYYHQSNYNSTAVSLFFVIAYNSIKEQNFNNLRIYSNKIMCIYDIHNHPNKFIILKSPENVNYEVNIPTKETTLNGWRNVSEQTPYCFLQPHENVNNYSHCSFSMLN